MDIKIKAPFNKSLEMPYKDIDNNMVSVLKSSALSNGQIELSEIALIEKAAKKDGKFTNGEKLLITTLRSQVQNNQVIKNLSLFEDKPPLQPEITVNPAQSSLNNLKNFSSNFLNSDKITQAEVLKFTTNLSNVKNKESLNLSLANLSVNAKNIVKGLDLDKTDFSKTLDKNVKSLPDFLNNFAKLNPNEQKSATDIMGILNQNPPKTDDKSKIKNSLDKFSKERSMEIGKTLNSIGVIIPSLNPNAPTAEDASSRIKVMYMGNYRKSDSPQSDYIRDALIVASKENFVVDLQSYSKVKKEDLVKQIKSDLKNLEGLTDPQITKIMSQNLRITMTEEGGFEWAEDNKFITNSGDIKTIPKLSEEFKPELRSLAFSMGFSPDKKSGSYSKEGIHTIGLPENDTNGLVDEKANHGAVSEKNANLDAEDLGKALNKKVDYTKTYIEGGNMLNGALPNGESYTVIGRDSVLTSVFNLERSMQNDSLSVPEFSTVNVNKKIGEMNKKGTFTKELINETIQKLQSADSIGQGVDKTQRAKEFLAKIEITEKEIFPQDIGSDKLIFIPQPDFHIDMHMRSVKPGVVMINDFDANIDLLKKAKANTKKDSWEDQEIDSMIENSQKMKKIMSPIMNEISKNLEQSGIKVIKAPGVIEGKTKKVNFMNATQGTSLGTNKQYYMSNFSTIKPIMDEFEKYIKSQGIDKVYWMGNTGGSEVTASGSEKSLNNYGGMDCRENHEDY